MKQWYLGITFVSIAFFQSMSAYRITLTPDSDLGNYKFLRIHIAVDHQVTNLIHETPTYWLKPGESKAWNQNTIRKEFGKKSKKVDFKFYLSKNTKTAIWHAFDLYAEASFNLGDNIKVKITNITEPRAPNEIGYGQPDKFRVQAWAE